MGREFEVKFSATPEKLAKIREKWEDWSAISMETTYFDTPDGALSKENCTLRCRLENGVAVCTIKTPISQLGRGEWDVQAPWCGETAAKLFAAAGRESIPFEQLTAVCAARFHRLTHLEKLPGGNMEIALDEGILLGGGRQIPLCEVEVEQKSGEETATLLWAMILAEEYGLQREKRSKFARASALARGE